MVRIATGRRKLSELLEEERLFLVSPHIEGIITLGAGEEVDEVAGGAGGMSLEGVSDVGVRLLGCFTRVSCRDRSKRILLKCVNWRIRYIFHSIIIKGLIL